MNYLRKYIVVLALMLSTAVFAAENYAEFAVTDTTLCYSGSKVSINFVVNVTRRDTNDKTLKCSTGTGESRSYTITTASLVDEAQYTITGLAYELESDEQTHKDFTVKLTSISDNDGSNSTTLSSTCTVHLYRVPTAEVVSDLTACGLSTELKANTRWSDISTYAWTFDEGVVTNAEDSVATFTYTEPATVEITLTETTGKTCPNTISAQLTFLGSPAAVLSYDVTENPDAEPIKICTSRDDESDIPFGATVDVDGFGPFSITTSDGQYISGLTQGENSIELHATKSDVITLAQVLDKNGCEAFASDVSGEVVVVDRRPSPRVDTSLDTITQTSSIELTGYLSSNDNAAEWTLADDYKDYYVSFVPSTSATTKMSSTMSGEHGIYFIEINNDGAACADTALLTINIEVDPRVPEGFSPNGDGVNDMLVIDGLVPENRVMIFDVAGKMIVDLVNYRNDFSASDLDDGYYSLVVTGTAMKTRKETLVIKRSK